MFVEYTFVREDQFSYYFDIFRTMKKRVQSINYTNTHRKNIQFFYIKSIMLVNSNTARSKFNNLITIYDGYMYKKKFFKERECIGFYGELWDFDGKH